MHSSSLVLSKSFSLSHFSKFLKNSKAQIDEKNKQEQLKRQQDFRTASKNTFSLKESMSNINEDAESIRTASPSGSAIVVELDASLKRDKSTVTICKTIHLNEDEIWNHLFLSLFERKHSENFACMDESIETFSSEFENKCQHLSIHFNDLLDKTLPYLKILNQYETIMPLNVNRRCYFTAVQFQVVELFKAMDKDFDKKLSYNEFYNGVFNILQQTDLASNKFSNFSISNINELKQNETVVFDTSSLSFEDHYKIEVDDRAMTNLFKRFDRDQDGFVNFSDFIRTFSIKMCQKRINVLNKAFDKLDVSSKDGFLDRADIKWWLTRRHQNYLSMVIKQKKSAREETEKLIDEAVSLWMDNFRDPSTNKPVDQIDRESFCNYYLIISSTIIDDSYFDLLIKHTYNI